MAIFHSFLYVHQRVLKHWRVGPFYGPKKNWAPQLAQKNTQKTGYRSIDLGLSENVGLICSHLIGIMISETIEYTLFNSL